MKYNEVNKGLTSDVKDEIEQKLDWRLWGSEECLNCLGYAVTELRMHRKVFKCIQMIFSWREQ